jgi:hypothetical protein
VEFVAADDVFDVAEVEEVEEPVVAELDVEMVELDEVVVVVLLPPADTKTAVAWVLALSTSVSGLAEFDWHAPAQILHELN